MESPAHTRPKIGVFTRPIDQGTSGSGHHLAEILSHALDQNDVSSEFDFVFLHYQKTDRPIYRRAPEVILPRNPLAAAGQIRLMELDVIHYSPLTVFSPVYGVRARKVATIHGAEQLLVPQFYSRANLLHEKTVVPHYVRKMDHILTVSETSRNFFVDTYRVSRERITVCPNAVGPGYRKLPDGPEREAAAATVRSMGVAGPYVLHISKFSKRKNPWTLIQGFAQFVKNRNVDGISGAAPPAGRADRATYQLVLAGKDWDNEEVRAFAARHGVAERIVTPGFVSEKQAVALLNNATAFVFPSLAEGFGMPNLEAMACGCPVITSAVFAIPEVVGDAALVMADPTDVDDLAAKLTALVTDRARREELIRRGAARVKQFSWEESAGRMLSVYRELAAAGRR